MTRSIRGSGRAALLLAGPYTPMLFMGEEWAASTPWQFFTAHREHELAEAVEFIDAFIRTPFPGEERHARRIAQLAEYETTGLIAGHDIR